MNSSKVYSSKMTTRFQKRQANNSVQMSEQCHQDNQTQAVAEAVETVIQSKQIEPIIREIRELKESQSKILQIVENLVKNLTGQTIRSKTPEEDSTRSKQFGPEEEHGTSNNITFNGARNNPNTTNLTSLEVVQIIGQMKTTIEVQTEEIICLKNELLDVRSKKDWFKNKLPKEPFVTSNRFAVLSTLTENETPHCEIKQKNTTSVSCKHERAKPPALTKSKNKTDSSKRMNSTKSISFPFKRVTLLSDSHGRHLAGLLKKKVPEGTEITGIVKPGGKYSDIMPKRFTPNPNECFIVMAGSNDLSSEENYGKLYTKVDTTLNDENFKKMHVMLCTLPKRHDLPQYHDINQKVSLINNYFKKSTIKMKNVTLVDISSLSETLHTKHGQHLNYKGKNFISNVLLQHMQERTPCQPASNVPLRPSEHKQATCNKQLFSYAEAVQLPNKEKEERRRSLDLLDISEEIQNSQQNQKNIVSHK